MDSIITRDDKLRLILTKLEQNFKKVNIGSSSVHSSSISNGHEQNDVKVRFPKLTIKKFNGVTGNWPSFWDQYDSAIHQKQNISDIDKFTYVKSYLRDSANSVISGLTLTSENYKDAIDLLRRQSTNFN